MSFLLMDSLFFLAAAALGYYLIPGRLQWVWLLLFSYLFYLASGIWATAFILTITLTIFLGGLCLERVDLRLALILRSIEGPMPRQREILKERYRKYKKWITAAVLLINFGILAVLKYRNFAVENISRMFGAPYTPGSLLLPLGISFYTFQPMGYLIDVYKGRYPPDHNLFRFVLFVSFFSQTLQGPIGRYDRLSDQLFGQRTFCSSRIEGGSQLMLWGYFKKIVIADRAAVIVNQVLGNCESYGGIVVITTVPLYSVQLYDDFSGDMDVVMGAAERSGISLNANFKRPCFARSISDFRHRWHITPGTWVKDYVFYPFSLSKGVNKFEKYCKSHCGKHIGRVLPVCIANLLVFFLVDVWHGPVWKYIVYGFYNGMIIAANNLFAPCHQKAAESLRIPAGSRAWAVVQILRIFILVNIGWYFDMAPSLGAALTMMKNTMSGLSLSALTDGNLLDLGLDKKDYVALVLSCGVLFAVSFFQENHMEIRKTLAGQSLAARWSMYLLLLFAIPLLGQINLTGGGFIYAQL